MKRRISLVIAFALSFLMMFNPIAMAEEMNLLIPVPTAESAEITIKVPLAETNTTYCPPPQEKASDRVWEEGEQIGNQKEEPKAKVCGECTSGGADGECLPTLNVRIRSKEVQIQNDVCGYCRRCIIHQS
jgi:hypothetical protein